MKRTAGISEWLGIGALAGILGSSPAFASCSKDRIEITHSTGFGLSLGGGKSSIKGQEGLNASIPVFANGQRGCWRQKSHLRFEAKADSQQTHGKVDIYPVEAEFEDLKNTNVHTYVLVETGFKVHVLSAVCVGDQVLSIESFSGEARQLSVEKHPDEAEVSSVFATGKAAEALRARLKSSPIKPGWGTSVPERFVHEVELRNATRPSCEPRIELAVPQVEIGTLVNAPGMHTQSGFSTSRANERVCTEEFKSALAPYEVGTYRKSKQAGGATLEYSKWRNRLRVRW